MKAKELLKAMLDWADATVEDTVDCFKIGDPEKEIKKVATCFIATPEVIKAPHAWGADLLITHEPTFYDHRDHMNNIPDEPIMQKKKALLESTGMAMYRYHDHTHNRTPDGIIEGMLKALPWSDYEWDGHFAVVLKEPKTANEVACDLEKYWNIGHVRRTGDLNTPMTKLCMMIGSYGDENQYKEMRAKGHEMAIVGETCEWRFGEYVRDASQFGEHIALLTCGHQGSEAAGMKWHAELIKNQFPELETKYFECGEVWSF